MKKKISRLLSTTLILLISISLLRNHARAQDIQTLAVDPRLIAIPLGNLVQLNLKISNGWNVNAYNIRLNYDDHRLSLNSWEHGSYLSNLICDHLINQPGVFELACTQAEQQDVSGNGVLLSLTFNTLELGSADVKINEAKFINSLGITLYPQKSDGSVVIFSETTAIPTLTSTQIATTTITSTVTRVIPTLTPSTSPSPTYTSTSTQTLTATTNQIDSPTNTRTPTITPTDPQSADETAEPISGMQYFDSVTPSLPLEDSSIDTVAQKEIAEQKINSSSGVIKVFWGFLIITIILILIFGIKIFIKQLKQKGDDGGLL